MPIMQGPPGKDGFGEAQAKQVIADVVSKIRLPKDGKDGRDGVEGKAGKNILERVIRMPDYTRLLEPDGSAQITFLQSGTGANSRTVQDRMRDWISVFDFMTAAQRSAWSNNDISTSVASAVQSALNATGAGVGLWCPPGSGLIGAPLVPKDYSVILGSGWSTVFHPSASVSQIFDLTGSRGVKILNAQLRTLQTTSPYRHILLGPSAFFNTLEHLYLNSNAKTSGQSAIAFTSDGVGGSHWNTVIDMQVASMHTGIDSSSTGSQGQNANRVIGGRIDDCVDGIVLGGATGNGADYNIIQGVTIGSFTGDGIRVGAQSSATLGEGLVFEGLAGSTVIRCAGNDNKFELVHASPAGVVTIIDTGSRNSFRERGQDSTLFTGVTGSAWSLKETIAITRLLINTLTNAGFQMDVAGTARIAGDLTLVGSMSSTGSVLSSHSAAGIGYAAGAGGTITQGSGSGKATAVTLSKTTGEITMDAANLNADTTVSFILTNTAIAATDHILVSHVSGGTLGAYNFAADPASQSATIYVRNITAGALAEAIVIRITVLKAVNA